MPATGDAVNVKVALRCRPLSKKELSEGDRSIFEKDGNVARLQDPDGRQNGGQPIEFGFDHVYDADSTQLQVYEDVGKPVVDAAFAGFNTTVFAYGQTGSGKSWSMTGGKDEQRGLIPRINAEIFERIESSDGNKLYLVQCSYFEIYNEIVGDSASVSERFRSSSCVFTKPRRRDAVDGAVRECFTTRSIDTGLRFARPAPEEGQREKWRSPDQGAPGLRYSRPGPAADRGE